MVAATPHPTIARDHCLAPSRSIGVPTEDGSGKYGRLFPALPGFNADEEFLLRLGRAEGPCDGGLYSDQGDDAQVAAGWPLFGQFVAHDITADRSLLLQQARSEEHTSELQSRPQLVCR